MVERTAVRLVTSLAPVSAAAVTVAVRASTETTQSIQYIALRTG